MAHPRSLRQEPAPPSVLSQLFPQPTGKNGIEDLIRAAELLRRSTVYAAMEQKPTLSTRRQVLADPPVRQARVLVENAFNKPLLPPERTLDLNTLFPEMALFRSLARLLNHEMYVFFAEGRTTYALSNLALGLKLGSVPKDTVLIGGLVGIAIDAIVLTRTVRHLEQLTYRDCDRVLQLLRDHREADQGNAQRALDTEHQMYGAILEQWQSNFKETVAAFVEEPQADEDGTPPDPAALARYRRTRQQIDAIAQDPAAQKRLIERVRQSAVQEVQRAKSYLQDPSVVPPPAPPLPPDSLEAALRDASLANYAQVVERFVTDRLNTHLMATHAAIRKYRWEFETLPDSLAVLRLSPFTDDPYTRQPLRYEKKGEAYELYSAGPLARDDDGNTTTRRTPVYLPFRRPPSS